MFPRNWNLRTVEDLCLRITSGGTPKRSNPNYYEPGTIPWIKTADLNDAYIHQYSEYISEAGLRESSAKLLPANTVLMAMYGATVGMLGMLTEEATCNQASCALIADPAVCDHRWLFYALLNDRDFIISQATGAAQQNLSGKTIRQFQYPTPPLKEQQAIAEVLGALDDKIAANTKLAETSSQLAQSIFAAAATNTEGVKVGLSESSHLLSRGITPKYSEDEDTMTILNQKCVRDQRVNLTPARRTDLAKVREEKILSQNDVLVNSTGQGTLGRVARWTHDKRVTVDSHITIIRFNPEEVDPVCAGFAVLRSEREITDMAEGSTGQTELSRIELGKLKILLPPREQQQELGQRLAKMAAMENAYLQENERLAATRDALLPQLMSGKLRVKDAEKVLDESL